jgi:hypothetical protein
VPALLKPRIPALVHLALPALAACLTAPAAAQDLAPADAAISVRARPRPDLDPVPLRLAGFELLPAADLRVRYDDNVYAARADRVADGLVTLGAGVSARSTWTHHAVSFAAHGALSRGITQGDQDTGTYDTRAAARLDLGPDTRATLHLGHARAYEPRGSIGDITIRGRRTPYHALEAGAGLQRHAGRLLLEAQTTLDSFDYAPIAGRARDYRTWSAALRAGYAIGPGVAAFVEGSYNRARYPHETAALDRNSHGHAWRTGLAFGLTRLIRGRAAIGHQDQRYADPAFPRIRGLDFGAALEWNPTRIVTWSLDARRTIQRSPLVGVAGIRQSLYASRLDYEARRNLILSARIERTVNDYAGTDRVQNDLSGELGAQWLLGPRLRLGAEGSFQRTRSEGTGGRRFERRRLSLSARRAL